jgi:hypothetical protein
MRPTARHTTVVHLRQLPPAAYSRLARALTCGAPVLARPLGAAGPIAAAAVSVFAAAALVTALCETGFGQLHARSAVLAPGAIAVMAAAMAVAGAAVGGMVRRLVHLGSLPFPPGVYVVGADLVDARGPVLRVTPMAHTRVEAAHEHVAGLYLGTVVTVRAPGQRHRFTVRGRREADGRLAALRTVTGALLIAAHQQDLAALERLDVFYAARMSDRWGRPELAVAPGRPPRSWAARAPLVGALVAAAAAPVLGLVRDRASDDALYASAVTVRDLHRYRAVGARHRAAAARRIDERVSAAMSASRARLGTGAPISRLVDALLAHQAGAGAAPLTVHLRPPDIDPSLAAAAWPAAVVGHHEHAIGGAVVAAVRALAPDDIVAVELGEPGPAGATAEVSWAVRPATDSRGGDALYEEVRGGEVVRRHRGAALHVEVVLRVPGTPPLRAVADVPPRAVLAVARDATEPAAVQLAMIERAIEALPGELAAALPRATLADGTGAESSSRR